MQPFEDPTQPPAEQEFAAPDSWAEPSEPSPHVVTEAELDQLDEEFLTDADELSDELDEMLLVAVDQPDAPAAADADDILQPATDEADASVVDEEILPVAEDVRPEPAAASPGLDLDAIAADLDGVDAALSRLAEGTYWTDEVTGEPLPPELLAESPTARRVG